MSKIIRTVPLTDEEYDMLHRNIPDENATCNVFARTMLYAIGVYRPQDRDAFKEAVELARTTRRLAKASLGEDITVNWVTRCIEVRELGDEL